jgi:hypothetical protein
MSVRGFAFGALLAVLAVTLVYGLKHSVHRLQNARDQLRAEIVDEQTRVTALRAEWAFLDRPERLRRLAERFTDLEPALPEQLAEVDALPARGPASDEDLQALLPGGAMSRFHLRPALTSWSARLVREDE